MASKILVKRSASTGNAPNTAQLDSGELAINTTDGVMYSANGTTVFEVGANLTNLSVTVDATVSGNVKVGDDLKDNSDRVFKVYYANGDIAWGE